MSIKTPHIGVATDLQVGDQYTYQYEDGTWSDALFYTEAAGDDLHVTTPVVILYRPPEKAWPTARAIVVREGTDYSGAVPDGTVLIRDKDGDYVGTDHAIVRIRLTDSIARWDDLVPVSAADFATLTSGRPLSATAARSLAARVQAKATDWEADR